MKSHEMFCFLFSRQCVAKSVAVEWGEWTRQMLRTRQMLLKYIKTAPTFPSECCQKLKNKSNSIYFTYLPTRVD